LIKDNCALVLGGYVNGYSIIQELSEKGVEDIILFDVTKKLGAYSNKVKKFVQYRGSADSLYQEIKRLNELYEKIIIFPTNDLELEYLHQLYDEIKSFCFLPFNYDNIIECSDKYIQYSYCEQLGLPYPKTLIIEKIDDLDKVASIQYPILIKPNKREDLKVQVFRNLQLDSKNDFEKNEGLLKDYLKMGISFLVSEIIPGDGSNIYAYVGYRNQQGIILNEWTGKKLSQYPNDFGVFSSASNEAPEEVLTLGRVLLNEMDIKGIAEPEFKYDYRDNTYKLMEINLRSMMWHRTGNLSGVNLQYTQYLDAIGKDVPKQNQIKGKDIHFVYLKHEIINTIRRRGYYRIFLTNVFKSDKTFFALYDIKDLKPFLIDCKDIIKAMVGICLKALKIL
jgi:predicted ATP-grasp superfamily ATP-dependent carboligase